MRDSRTRTRVTATGCGEGALVRCPTRLIRAGLCGRYEADAHALPRPDAQGKHRQHCQCSAQLCAGLLRCPRHRTPTEVLRAPCGCGTRIVSPLAVATSSVTTVTPAAMLKENPTTAAVRCRPLVAAGQGL